jgi:hypothetical protein
MMRGADIRTASEMGGLSPATGTASEMGGSAPPIMTASELDALAFSDGASDNFDVVIKSGQRDGNMFKRVCDAFGRVVLFLFWDKWAPYVRWARRFDSHGGHSCWFAPRQWILSATIPSINKIAARI